MVSEKSIMKYTFLHCCGARMYQKSQQTKHTNKMCSKFSSSFIQPLKLPYCVLVIFIDMTTYILTEGKNFKTFLKENNAIALDNCYLFTKKMLIMEMNMILMVYMEFA